MLQELNIFKNCGHFLYRPSDRLSSVCNAPGDQAGVYTVYAVWSNQQQLVYIGISGQMNKDGKFKVRKDGLKGRLVNGKRDREPRSAFWLRKMEKEQLDGLLIFWYVTCNPEGVGVLPGCIEKQLVEKYRPAWNR